MILRYFLKTLALPPMISILVALLAILLWRRRPVLARTLAVVSLASLWLFSSPVVSTGLMRSLEAHYPVLSEELRETTEAEAIVILAGGIDDSAREFGFPVSEDHTLLRLRYGAFLHRETGLPILVSGGSVFGDDDDTLAATMARELAFSFQYPLAGGSKPHDPGKCRLFGRPAGRSGYRSYSAGYRGLSHAPFSSGF